MNKPTQFDYVVATIFALGGWWYFIIIFVVGVSISLFNACFGEKIDPMDNTINKSREVVDFIAVKDSTHNGFEIAYVTVNAVSDKRLDEIRSRKEIKQTFKSLKEQAPEYFGHNLLYTDIYDFVDFALQYEVMPDVEIHQIFVYGYEKQKQYIGDNPKIPNSARWLNVKTLQGVQYIKKDDIYIYRKSGYKLYRYWKCGILHNTSTQDEHFSHFSEDERIS